MKISIDGPAASGKTVVGKSVSKMLDLTFLDTGLMYRAATWICVKNDIDMENIMATTQIVSSTNFEPTSENGRDAITVNGETLSQELYKKEINESVSLVAKIKGVRECLVNQQKTIAQGGSIVMVGRDIGTIVMPDAAPKVFLEASLDVRAYRRLSETKLSVGDSNLSQIKKNLMMRDQMDSERKESPLRPANSALLIDTTKIGIKAVVATIVAATKTK
jgi:cytidylate kinase